MTDIVQQTQRRTSYAISAANALGATLVFTLGLVVLPNPRGVHHAELLIALNVIAFCVAAPLGLFVGWRWSGRLWSRTLGWIRATRSPTARERELTLRLPLTQQKGVAALWIAAAVLFATINGLGSHQLGFNVGIGILLGGLVTCSLGFLLGERLFRPIAAIALADEVPRQPPLPGISARTLLSWATGTGAVLFALAMLGLGGIVGSQYSERRLAIAMFVLSLVGMLVGVLSMIGLARSVADPIEGLRVAVGGVEDGDLEQRVTVDDGGEIGLLQAGFNQMVSGLRERERLRDLFGRQVGEDVARRALEHGVELGGEAVEAAVLFVDLRGSTGMAESQGPAEVVEALNAFFAIVVDVVGGHGGWVNKFEGDGALCIFGAPMPDADATSQALACARALNRRLTTELPELVAGIGVSAGRVVAGNVGAARRFEYTVIGDPVNEAARLTDLAKGRTERVVASAAAVQRASPDERRHWAQGESVTLRGRTTPTVLATPV